MKKITPEYLSHVRQAPQFVEAVLQAKRQGAPTPVTQALDAFEDDPFLLYACLWYAGSEGVAVTFLPAK